MIPAILVSCCKRCKNPLTPTREVGGGGYYCMHCKSWVDTLLFDSVTVPTCPKGHGALEKRGDHWTCCRTGIEYFVDHPFVAEGRVLEGLPGRVVPLFLRST